MAKSKIDKLKKKSKATKMSEENASKFLLLARERATEGATYWKNNLDAAEADLRFLSGETQWPENIKTERQNQGRPCLTNNVLPTFVDQVIGDQLQNRPTIKVSPVDAVRVEQPDGQDPQTLKIENTAGNKDYELGEVMSGLVRNIEYNCDAESSYDIAFQAALESGIGYLRVRTDYLNDDSFEQEIIIDHIENQFSVIPDPHGKERDGSDRNWYFVDEMMEKSAFEDLYPDAVNDPITSESTSLTSWYSDKSVRVSEYFIRKPYEMEIALMSDGRTLEVNEDLEDIVDDLLDSGISIVRTRKVKSYKTYWYKITGLNILEGPIEVKSTVIPIHPVYGKALAIKNEVMFRSLHRYSHDAQRMANYWDSAATESVALAPKAPFIGSEEHIEGHEDEWQSANKNNQSILTYTATYQGDPGPRREQPAAVPSAELTLGANSVDKIKATLGMFDASVGAKSNETSGIAINARQRQGDRGTFAYTDNLRKTIRRVGKTVIEMAMSTYDSERIIRLKFPDDTEDFVKINEQVWNEEKGEYVTIKDLGVSKYDVVVTTGPAYATQRLEAAESMLGFAKAVPASAQAVSDLVVKNMDWPGADVIAARLNKTIPQNLLTEDERKKNLEDAPVEATEPTPEQELQMKELETRMVEAESKIAIAKEDTAKAQAVADKAEADAKKAEIELSVTQKEAVQGDDDYQKTREMVAQALVELTNASS